MKNIEENEKKEPVNTIKEVKMSEKPKLPQEKSEKKEISSTK